MRGNDRSPLAFAAFGARRGRLPLHRWAAAVLWSLAFSLFAPQAFAVAPMCDPSGASIPAPTPAPPAHDGDIFVTKHCSSFSGDGPSADRRGQDQPNPDRVPERGPDRALPIVFTWAAPAGERIDLADAVLDPVRPGFSNDVFRPPRA